jgi:tRNA threonylcarbamoyladenosine biosynthesis protein TsaE
MYSIIVENVSGLRKAARELLDCFPNEHVFAFYGSMGAGKTTFIKAICRELGSADNITSPTFALINEYSDGHGHPIFHFDFYRIKKMDEAFDLGYEDYLYSNNYCLIEWPEMIQTLLPAGIIEVRIKETTEGFRRIDAIKM